MAVVAEFREFFHRNSPMNSGSKPDQEAGYPYYYNVVVTNPDGTTRTVTVGNRFNRSDVPSENTFKKLLASCAFLLNPEDSAQLDRQGLVKKPNGLHIVNRVNNDSGFTIGVTPSNLPKVSSNTNNPSNFSITKKYYSISNNLEVVSPSPTDEVYENYIINYENPPLYETYKLVAANNPNANLNTFPIEIDVDGYNKVIESNLNYSIVNGMKIKSKVFFTTVPDMADITLDRLKVKLGSQDLFAWTTSPQLGSLENVGQARGLIEVELTFFDVNTTNNTCKVASACSLEFFDYSSKSYLTIPNDHFKHPFKAFESKVLNLNSLSSSQLLKVMLINDFDLGNTIINYYEVTASR